MFLFEKEDNTFFKYELIPNKEKIRNFKYNEMKTIPIGERVLYAETNDKKVLEYACSYGIHTLTMEELNYSKRALLFFKDYHKLCCYNELKLSGIKEKINKSYYINNLLEKYYNGKYDKGYLFKVLYDNYEEYLLIDFVNNSYKYYDYSNKKILDNIILLTKPLYNLHLFLKRQYNDLSEEDISKIINLFDFKCEPIKTIIQPKEDYKNLLNHCVDEQEKVLKLVKDKNL